MKWFNILRDRLRALRQRDTVINDIDREMRSHLDLQTEANIRTETKLFQLQEANEALQQLREGKFTGAAVLVMPHSIQ